MQLLAMIAATVVAFPPAGQCSFDTRKAHFKCSRVSIRQFLAEFSQHTGMRYLLRGKCAALVSGGIYLRDPDTNKNALLVLSEQKMIEIIHPGDASIDYTIICLDRES
jgi:hypothetical protein